MTGWSFGVGKLIQAKKRIENFSRHHAGYLAFFGEMWGGDLWPLSFTLSYAEQTNSFRTSNRNIFGNVQYSGTPYSITGAVSTICRRCLPSKTRYADCSSLVNGLSWYETRHVKFVTVMSA